jgi:hypothetical protein
MPVFDTYISLQRHEASICTFANLFSWRDTYSFEWAVVSNALWIKGYLNNHPFILPPFGYQKDTLRLALKTAQNWFCQNDYPFVINGATLDFAKTLTTILPGYFSFVPDRNDFDYVYRLQDLIELKGNKYRTKRNHINSFKRRYPSYQFVPLTGDSAPHCLEILDSWNRSTARYGQTTSQEHAAMADVLNNFSYLNLFGGAITIDDKFEAFSVGENLNDDTIVVHIEKANPQINGLYQMINWEFCKHFKNDKKYVNREEDMGIPGLKTAKESYHPAKMIVKYIAIAKRIIP